MIACDGVWVASQHGFQGEAGGEAFLTSLPPSQAPWRSLTHRVAKGVRCKRSRQRTCAGDTLLSLGRPCDSTPSLFTHLSVRHLLFIQCVCVIKGYRFPAMYSVINFSSKCGLGFEQGQSFRSTGLGRAGAGVEPAWTEDQHKAVFDISTAVGMKRVISLMGTPPYLEFCVFFFLFLSDFFIILC